MTLDQIQTDLVEYADFEEVASVSRARLFVTAAIRWLILQAESAGSQSQSMSVGKQYVENLLARANAYISASGTTSGSTAGRTRFLHVGSAFR